MSALADRLLHVFHRPAGHQIRLLLPAMITVSLAAHGALFYLVGTTPSRPAPLPPLPAKITLLPSNASLLLAARDPSWLDPGRYRERLLPSPHHVRIVRALQPTLTPLRPAPSAPSAGAWVPFLPPLAVRPWFERGAARPPAPEFVPITARFGAGGPEVTADVLGRLRASAPATLPGQTTELLVVLDVSGEVRHAWVLRSCGDASLDLAAQRAVQLSRFGVSAQEYRGVLRIVWGYPGATP
ncbi:MAG: hypothetical protein JHC52_06505 [Chthoniobacterales bacterium]|nr:hypothetical protein [Chthoniobacterales bacterium]